MTLTHTQLNVVQMKDLTVSSKFQLNDIQTTAKQHSHQHLKDVHTLLNDINTYIVECCSQMKGL